jgi:hypothetical protein
MSIEEDANASIWMCVKQSAGLSARVNSCDYFGCDSQAECGQSEKILFYGCEQSDCLFDSSFVACSFTLLQLLKLRAQITPKKILIK